MYDAHVRYGAHIVDFAGFDMPVYYTTVIDEHHATRNQAGLFDTSHMGEIRVKGRQALDLIQEVVSRDCSKLVDGQVALCVMCNDQGGIMDDCTVNRFGPQDYMMVVNAGTKDKDLNQILSVQAARNLDCQVIDETDDTAKLDLQGPFAEVILQKMVDINLNVIKYYRFALGKLDGVDAMLSRSGYTGEDGFEIYFPAQYAERMWEKLFELGREHGLKPCGLGARDTLRTESGYMLYGNDIDECTTPLECVYGWVVHLDKKSFVGKAALVRQKHEGIKKKLVGFEMLDKAVARHNYLLYMANREVGKVTSGCPSPTLGKNIGMAYVSEGLAEVGNTVDVRIRAEFHKARMVPMPFYKRKK